MKVWEVWRVVSEDVRELETRRTSRTVAYDDVSILKWLKGGYYDVVEVE